MAKFPHAVTMTQTETFDSSPFSPCGSVKNNNISEEVITKVVEQRREGIMDSSKVFQDKNNSINRFHEEGKGEVKQGVKSSTDEVCRRGGQKLNESSNNPPPTAVVGCPFLSSLSDASKEPCSIQDALGEALMDCSRNVEINSENRANALAVMKEIFAALSSSQDTLQETEGATSDKNRDDPQPNTEKQNSFGRDFGAQKHSLSNPPGHRSRPTHNSSYNSGYHQKQRYSNKGHQQLIYNNDRNFNMGHNNAPPAPVNWHSHMPGYVYDHVGFHELLPLPPHSPYLHPHFAFMNNHPLDANVPFPPIPFSAPHWIHYPGYDMPVGYNSNPFFQEGVAFVPQTPHPSNLQDLEYKLCDAIKDQIEFYFSVENLESDTYLRKRMNAFGWVSADLIANLPLIKRLTGDIDLILRVLRGSQYVEVGGRNIRRRENWKEWVFPPSMRIQSNEKKERPAESNDSPRSIEAYSKETKSAVNELHA